MCKTLTSRITRYMQDQSARYAIALEGDWGTGKTRFCETVLADKLYPLGYDVLRISLFGVTSTEEVYGRLAMSMLRLASDEDDNRVQRFFKGLAAKGAQTAIAYSTHKLSEIGVSIEASPQMLTGILGKKQLLVLDDVERLGMDEAFRNELFGLVNNLVEVQDCKVMFVTNHYDSIPADIREKLVWKCYRFEPSPEDLVEAIVLPIVLEAERKPEFDVSRSLTRAAIAASCRNARAMIKSTELLKEAIACEAVSDKQIDAANRERALREFSRFTFLAAMDEAPTDQFHERYDKEVRAERIIQRAEYSTYQQLWVIKAFFDPRIGVKEGDVGVCLKDFIKSTYGGSPGTMVLKRILDSTTGFATMDDAQVADLATQLSTCISETTFDSALLNRAVQVNMTLRRWGFEEALTDERLLVCAKQLVDIDAEEAYQKVHSEFMAWYDEWSERYSVLLDLDKYIVDRYEASKTKELEEAISLENPNAGLEFADTIREDLSRGGSLLLDCAPEFIADLFSRGNADSQYAICELVVGLQHFAVFRTNERARAWAKRLHDVLIKIEPKSRMDRKRFEWTLDGLRVLV